MQRRFSDLSARSDSLTLDSSVVGDFQIAGVDSDEQPPAAPRYINVAGRSGHVVIWWDTANVMTDKILHYEVKRFRYDENSKQWIPKGCSIIRNVQQKYHTIQNLQSMQKYRFSVCGVNKIDKGPDSKMSSAVFIESDLPNGWFRLHDSNTDKQFYYCPKSGKSSWTRPDANPYFLDCSISRHFTDREIISLIDLFNDEIRNFEAVTKYRFKDSMEELGRPCSDIRYLHRVFRECVEWYSPEAIAHKDAEKKAGTTLEKDSVRTFQGFMIIVKFTKYRALRVKQNPFYVVHELANLRMKRDDNTDPGVRMADWVLSKGTFINGMKYRGIYTKQVSFFTPRDFILYLPLEKKHYFESCFEPDEIDAIQKIYQYLDVELCGKMYPDEFCQFVATVAIILASRSNNAVEKGPMEPDLTPQVNPVYLDLFSILDSKGRGYLRFEDFVLFFVSLPKRETPAKRSFLERSDSLTSLAHQSHRSLPMSEKSLMGKHSSKIIPDADANSVRSFRGLDIDDGQSVSTNHSGKAQSRLTLQRSESRLSEFGSSEKGVVVDEGPEDDGVLQGNEFRVVNLVVKMPELEFLRAEVTELNAIFDELMVSNKEETVWETNKLKISDMLITKPPPVLKKVFDRCTLFWKNVVDKLKIIFERKPIEEEEVLIASVFF